jgi:hypothetical protein
VTDWGVVFLGVIAAATLITALAQVGFIVATGRLARRLERAADDMQREVRPLVEHLDAIGRDSRRASSLAAAQLERVDYMAANIADTLDRTLNTLQTAAAGGVREGTAMLAAFRAAMAVVREFRASRARAGAEDDDALFI